jgi:flavodoxin
MSEDELALATKVMGAFINSLDPKTYTKNALMSTHGYDQEKASELSEAAYQEWVEAYGG